MYVLYRRPKPKGLLLSVSASSSVPSGVQTHVLLGGVRQCNQSANYPAEIVRVLAGFSTELPPVPSECCTASEVDKCIAAMAHLCLFIAAANVSRQRLYEL